MRNQRTQSKFRCEAITDDIARENDCGHGVDPRPQENSTARLTRGGKTDNEATDGIDQKILIINTDPTLAATRFSQVMATVITPIYKVATIFRR